MPPVYFGMYLLQQMTLAAIFSWWLAPLVSKGVKSKPDFAAFQRSISATMVGYPGVRFGGRIPGAGSRLLGYRFFGELEFREAALEMMSGSKGSYKFGVRPLSLLEHAERVWKVRSRSCGGAFRLCFATNLCCNASHNRLAIVKLATH